MKNIEISFTKKISPNDLKKLFKQVKWTENRNLSSIRIMLNNSDYNIGAWKDKRLIGYARIITDYIYRALVDDIIVDTNYRGFGIGTKIIAAIKNKLKEIELIVLGCEDSLINFYKKNGFKKSIHNRMEIRKSVFK